jgi:hypothetical protein
MDVNKLYGVTHNAIETINFCVIMHGYVDLGEEGKSLIFRT